MRIHAELATPSFDLPPVAAAVGPFPGRAFVTAWWEHAARSDHLMIADDGQALLALVRDGDVVRFAGDADLTDYHSPLGAGVPDLVVSLVGSLGPGVTLSLDSMPAEAVDVIVKGLAAAGLKSAVSDHEVAAVLDLPSDPDAYLADLGKKQRHEVRRKRRRFTEALGPPRFARGGPAEMEAFVRMHRAAAGEKGDFMTPEMEVFFSALLADAGARLDVLYGDGDEPVAAAVAFEDDDAYYLYNSAYDPAMAEASPGIVLVTGLIDRAIRSGKPRFDFLKGDEQYKFRLGAEARQLYVVEAAT